MATYKKKKKRFVTFYASEKAKHASGTGTWGETRATEYLLRGKEWVNTANSESGQSYPALAYVTCRRSPPGGRNSASYILLGDVWVGTHAASCWKHLPFKLIFLELLNTNIHKRSRHQHNHQNCCFSEVLASLLEVICQAWMEIFKNHRLLYKDAEAWK